MAGAGVSFSPPPYPYERLDVLKKLASVHDGGPIDCSIGTPIDPPPDAVLRELAKGTGARGYPTSQGSPDFRASAQAWMERRFGVVVPVNDVAACIGTKEFVGTLAGYLHLRSPDRDTVLYPAISYPTYAMGATLAGLRAVPVAVRDGHLDLESIHTDDIARALVLWANSPSNPTGHLDDLEGIAAWGRRHEVLVASDECYAEFTWAGRPRSILEHGSNGVLALHSVQTCALPISALELKAIEPRRATRRLLRRRRGFDRIPQVGAPARGVHGAGTHPGGRCRSVRR